MIVIVIVSVTCSLLCGLYLKNPRNGESSEILERILYISDDEVVDAEPDIKPNVSEEEAMEGLDDSPLNETETNYAEDAESILREINNG